jgi:hypothetical protein
MACNTSQSPAFKAKSSLARKNGLKRFSFVRFEFYEKSTLKLLA